jgi:hypothetical protein
MNKRRGHKPNMLEARAVKAARGIGLEARKSLWRLGTPDNRGGFMLFDTARGRIVGGADFELSAKQVINLARKNLKTGTHN